MSTAPPPPAPPKPSTPTAARPSSPPPPSATGPSPQTRRSFRAACGVAAHAHRVVVYGPGGVGKTELASMLNQVNVIPFFIDLEDGTKFHNVSRCEPAPQTFDELRQVLQDDQLWDGFGAVVIDSLTKAEELCIAWTLANVPKNEQGHRATSIESYGFGKGFTHSYESFLPLLGDLDAHIRKGRHVICLAHECTTTVPNPTGDDWLRYEPRLQSPASGKASIRHRVKEWCDHLIYIGFDVSASKEGKGVGGGTRTIYPTELPAWWAKSRSLSNPIPYRQGDAELWRQMFAK